MKTIDSASEENEIVIYTEFSEMEVPYSTTTWYQCHGIQKFVEKVQEENKIVGVIFSGNNLGFIIDKNL